MAEYPNNPPDLSPVPPKWAHSAASDKEWEEIERGAQELIDQQQRGGITSEPDIPANLVAETDDIVRHQYEANKVPSMWTMRSNQDPHVVHNVVQRAARGMIETGDITDESQQEILKLLSDRRLELTQRDMGHLAAKTVELVERAYGPMWNKVLDDEGSASLLANAMVQALGENSLTLGLNSYGTGEWEMVWNVQRGTMRRPDLVKDGPDFWGLIQNYEAYKQFCDTSGWSHPSGYRGPKSDIEELHRLYTAVTGAVYKPQINKPEDWFKGFNEPLEGFYKGTKWAQQKSKALVPLQALGIEITPDMVDDEGRVPANVIPFNNKTSEAYYGMLAEGWSLTNPRAMAEYKTLEEMRDRLYMAPERFLAEVNGTFTDTQVRELDAEPNVNRRVWNYLQQIDPEKTSGVVKAASGQPQGGTVELFGQTFERPDGKFDSEVQAALLDKAGKGLAAAVHRGEDLYGKFKTWENQRYSHYLRNQDKIPANIIDLIEETITPEKLKERRKEVIKSWNDAYRTARNDPKRFFQENNIPFKALVWVLNTAGSAWEATSLSHMTEPWATKTSDFAMNHFLDPAPGDDILVGQRQIPLSYLVGEPEGRNIPNWMANNLTWGHTPQHHWDHMYRRHLTGKANFGDDLTVMTMALRDFGADLPGALYSDPIGMYVLGKTLGKYSKTVKQVAEKARKAGMPRPMVAAMQLAAEPMHPIAALDTMFGVNYKVMEGLRTSAGEYRKVMNRAAKHAPHLVATEKARVARALDLVEEAGMAPKQAVQAVRAVHADAMARLERGEKLSWVDAEKVLEESLNLPVDVARNILPPPMQLPHALREPAKMLWEADKVVAELEKMDNMSARQLKEMTGKSYAEHVAEGQQAWFSRPDIYMPKRHAFYKLLEKLPIGDRAREKLKQAYTVHTEWDHVLPAASEKFRHALMSKKVARQAFADHAQLSHTMKKHYEVDMKAEMRNTTRLQDKQRRILDREAYLNNPIQDIITRENYLREYMAHELGIQLPERITAKTIGQLRAKTKQAKQTVLEEMAASQQRMKDIQFGMEKHTGLADDLTYSLNQGFKDFTSTKGVEFGYRNPLTTEQRAAAVRRHVIPQLDLYQKTAKMEGIPARMVELDALIQDRVQRQYGNALRKKEITRPEFDALMYEARVRGLSTRQAWDISPIEETQRLMIQGQRELVELWRQSAKVGDNRFRIWDVAQTDKYSSFKGAHVSELVHGMVADMNPLLATGKRLREKYWHRLTDWDRKMNQRAMTEPGFAENQPLTSHFMSMFADLEGFRKMALDEALRVGRITDTQYQIYAKDLYVERYYADNVFANELNQMGFDVSKAADGKMPPINRPKFNAFKAQRSSAFARVFYRERGTGKIQEHRVGVEEAGGAEAADKAAQQWAEGEIAAGRMEKHHFIEVGDKAGDYVVKVMTDKEMGGMGVIAPNGEFRINRLESILRDTMKRRLLNHVGQMRGWVRTPEVVDKRMRPRGVDQSEYGQWTGVLRGKEWGPLEGKVIHKTLVRTMNTLDMYGEVLEAVRDQFVSEHAIVKSMSGLDKAMGFRFRELAKTRPWAAHVDGLMRSVYHNLIVKNWDTWITNHLGNWFSMGVMGLNPISTRTFSDGTLFNRVLSDLSKYDLTKGGGRRGMRELVENKYGRDVAEDFFMLYDRNMLGPTVGSEHLGQQHGGRGHYPAFRDLRAKQDAAISKQRARVDQIEQALAMVRRELELAAEPGLMKSEVLTGKKLKSAEALHERLLKLRKKARAQLYQEWTANPLWQGLKGGAKEVRDFVFNTDASLVAQAMSTDYGLIDARYKFIAARGLRRQGIPAAEAMSRIENLMQNYNKVPAAVRSLKNAPIMGAMVPSFTYEAARILKNSFTKYPGRSLGAYLAPMLWNTVALGARGMTLGDMLYTDSSENRAQALMKMFTRLYIPTKDGVAQVYIGKYNFTNVLEHSSGIHRMWGRHMQKKLDQTFGPGPAMIMSSIANLASAFVGTNPWVDTLSLYQTGADTFDQQVAYGSGVGQDILSALADRAIELLVPKTATSVLEEVTASHEKSQITGHQKSKIQTALRIATGLSLSGRKDTEAVGLMALKYSRMEQFLDAYKRMKSDDQVRLKEAAVRARTAADAEPIDREEFEKQYEIVKDIVKRGKDQLVYHAGEWISIDATPEEIARQAVNYISRDVLGVIENVPIDRVPDFYADMMLSPYRDASPAAVEHIFKQMGTWEKVQDYSDPSLLRVATEKTAQYATKFRKADPKLAAQFDEANLWLSLQRRLLEPTRLPVLERVMAQKEALEKKLAGDPVGQRKAILKMLDAELRMKLQTSK